MASSLGQPNPFQILQPSPQPAMSGPVEKDPVCGMDVDPKRPAGTHEHRGETYYFAASTVWKSSARIGEVPLRQGAEAMPTGSHLPCTRKSCSSALALVPLRNGIGRSLSRSRTSESGTRGHEPAFRWSLIFTLPVFFLAMSHMVRTPPAPLASARWVELDSASSGNYGGALGR
jgi:YHS domain-containing protein